MIAAQCPAFAAGCPFASAGGDAAHHFKMSPEKALALAKCPAFANGCPFKGAKTAVELRAVRPVL